MTVFLSSEQNTERTSLFRQVLIILSLHLYSTKEYRDKRFTIIYRKSGGSDGGDAGDVFADDVEFEVDFGARLDAMEVGVVVSVRDNRHSELVAL